MSITKNDNAVTLSRTALEYMAGLINKIVSAPEQLIDDVNLQTVTTFSSVRLNSLINETLQDAKDYTDEICGALVKLTCEKTTTQPTLSNSEKNVIYLYSSDGNAPFEQYLKISDTELIDMGSTSISLNDYLTITDAVATYCKKTDFNSLVTEVDKVKTTLGTKVNRTDVVDNITSTDTDKPLSANQGKVLKDEVDKKAEIDDTQSSTTTVYSSDKVDEIASNIEVVSITKTQALEFNNLIPTENAKEKTFVQIYSSDILNAPSNEVTHWIVKASRIDSEIRQTAMATHSNAIYVRSTTDNNNWTPWQRICTTSVADVDWTQSTMGSGMAGDIYYRIKNGICYVYVRELKSSTMSTASQTIASNLPVPERTEGVWHIIVANRPTEGTLLVNINSTGKMTNNIGVDNASYYGSFSYPVAES